MRNVGDWCKVKDCPAPPLHVGPQMLKRFRSVGQGRGAHCGVFAALGRLWSRCPVSGDSGKAVTMVRGPNLVKELTMVRESTLVLGSLW